MNIFKHAPNNTKKYFLCQSFSIHNMIFSIWKPFQCFQNYLFQVNCNYQFKIKGFHWNNNRKIIWKKGYARLIYVQMLITISITSFEKALLLWIEGQDSCIAEWEIYVVAHCKHHIFITHPKNLTLACMYFELYQPIVLHRIIDFCCVLNFFHYKNWYFCVYSIVQYFFGIRNIHRVTWRVNNF